MLRGRDETLDHVTLVLSADAATQDELHRRADDPGNLWVAPPPSGLTRLLLARRPLDVLIVCHEMLKDLDPRRRTLTADAVDRALHGIAVERALEGWKNLGVGDQDSRLDRIVVYSTIERGELTPAGVLERLDELGESVEPERLQRSLDRLELAFVLGRRDQATYEYTVPLFVERLRDKGPAELLLREIARPV